MNASDAAAGGSGSERPMVDKTRWLAPLLALPFLLLTGCVDRTTNGGTTTYTFALWIVGVAVLLGLALIAIGYFTRKKGPVWKTVFVILLGVVVIAIGVPMMWLDRVEVDDEHFVSTHGLPWDRKTHDVRFDQLQGIQVEMVVTKQKNGAEKKSYTLQCSKSGGGESVPVGNVMERAVGQILGNARKKGVPLTGVEQLPDHMKPE